MDQNRLETLFQILSDPKFLQKEGLGNEVPYFIETYDIRNQTAEYRGIQALVRRLESSGIPVAVFGLYDFVIEHFQAGNELEALFEAEKTVDKAVLLEEMIKMLSVEYVIVPAIAHQARDKEARLVFLYQAGEVYPYLRIHEILSTLQAALSDRPVIVFFPGTYTTSYRDGFKLSLFGTQTARYYRAFKLDDYLARRTR